MKRFVPSQFDPLSGKTITEVVEYVGEWGTDQPQESCVLIRTNDGNFLLRGSIKVMPLESKEAGEYMRKARLTDEQ